MSNKLQSNSEKVSFFSHVKDLSELLRNLLFTGLVILCVVRPQVIPSFLEKSELDKLSFFGFEVERKKKAETQLETALKTVNAVPASAEGIPEIESKPVNQELIRTVSVAKQIIPASVPTYGWIFLGRVTSNQKSWEEGQPATIETTSLPIDSGRKVTIRDDVYLRGDAKPGEYISAGAVISVARKGEHYTVESITPRKAKIGGYYLWAKVHIDEN